MLSKFLAPVSILLEIAILFQLVLGEYFEGSIVAALLLFNTALGFFHESRAQSTIAALKSRLALNASVAIFTGSRTDSRSTGKTRQPGSWYRDRNRWSPCASPESWR
jgi:magnesium-transporting ATPase (P-type)